MKTENIDIKRIAYNAKDKRIAGKPCIVWKDAKPIYEYQRIFCTIAGNDYWIKESLLIPFLPVKT